MTDRELVYRAVSVRLRAYAPYSSFHVGAALLSGDGRVYEGCNMECAAFGAGICAERAALSRAISDGNRNFLTIAVAADGESLCVPCGICRQMLFELAPRITVLCSNERGEYKSYGIEELLPHAFGLSGH